MPLTSDIDSLELQVTHYAMIFDMAERLLQLTSEKAVIEVIFNIFNMICAPTCQHMLMFDEEGRPVDILSNPTTAVTDPRLYEWMAAFTNDFKRTESGDGFMINIDCEDARRTTLLLTGIRFPNKMNQYINFAMTISPLLKLGLSNARNLERLQRANDELNIARMDAERLADKANQANQAKRLFLARVSHDIRTPMSGIIGIADLLETTGMTADQHRLVSLIGSNTKALLELLNDILDFSKIEAAKLILHPQPFDLFMLINDIVTLMNIVANEKKVELTLTLAAGVPQYITADAMRIRQVLNNLLSNALKFTKHGAVHLDVATEDSDPASENQDIRLRLRVTDTGDGIPAEKMHLLFRTFEQLDGEADQAHAGTGLGLAICKQLAELMGGRMEAQSELGKGSVFTFTMRCSVPMPPDTPTTQREQSHIKTETQTSQPIITVANHWK